jgi:DNA ligase-1
MQRFAETADAIARQSAKLEKTATLAAYLASLDDRDLPAATRFFTGNPFAARDPRSLAIGGRTIVAVAKRIWGFDDEELSAGYRASGDLGSALGGLMRAPLDAMLWSEHLTPASLLERFGEIADAAGKNAGKRREAVLEGILRACPTGLEVSYVVKIMTGDLRIGLAEGLVIDAIARAFEASADGVRRGLMATGDIGEVAIAAKDRALDRLTVSYDAPIGFMLAGTLPYGERYPQLEEHAWIVEDKYDGIRLQAHIRHDRARLFSRTLSDVSASYPEIVLALSTLGISAIVDGELIASRDGQTLPFRTLQARLQRKSVDAALQREVPLRFVIFDLLAAGDEMLIDEPLLARRERLAASIVPGEAVVIAPFDALDAHDGGAINERFAAARSRGNEGLMFKRADGAYAPGRRGKAWLKLKRELSTLDVVVVAVEWGHGKRAQVLSDYTFAVRGDDGVPVAIGKAYSGLTDAEIAGLTPWFLEHRLPDTQQREKARSREIPVEPQIVIEIAFDVIMESDLHESGFSLRFPRIVRIRDDKPVTEIDTLDRVREIYREILQRENGPAKPAG